MEKLIEKFLTSKEARNVETLEKIAIDKDPGSAWVG